MSIRIIEYLCLVADGSGQLIADVLLFSQHGDPQVQGTTALIVGTLVKAAVCTDSHFPSSSAGKEEEEAEQGRYC